MKSKKALLSVTSFLLVALFATDCLFAESYRVRSSDNLDRIVKRFYHGKSYSKAQIKVGILAANPKAFKDGNINYLLRGKRLELPNDSFIQRIAKNEANTLIKQHNFFFRGGVTGDELLLKPYLLENQATAPEKTAEKQPKQASKIEAESSDLRKQLEELFADQQQDEKLAELESIINKSFQNESFKDKQKETPESTETKTKKKIEAKVKVVDKAPVKTKIQIKSQTPVPEVKVETSNKTGVIEKSAETEISESKNLPQEIENQVSEPLESDNEEVKKQSKGPVSSPAVATLQPSQAIALPKSDQASVVHKAAVVDKLTTDQKNNSFWASLYQTWGNTLWLFPVLLLVILWYLLKGIKRPKIISDDNIDFASQIASVETTRFLPADLPMDNDSNSSSIKIDMAKSYLEAGDNESAKSILKDVLTDGTARQKTQAEKILDTLRSV